MIGFYVVAALLTLMVVAWMARALLRPPKQSGVSSQRLNAALYQQARAGQRAVTTPMATSPSTLA